MLEKYCPKIQIVGKAREITTGLRLYNQFHPQIIFLDVQMSDGSGLELLEKLQGEQVEVIFITAFEKYAINAIRLSALDYLLKPVDPKELMDAMRRFEQKHRVQKDFSIIQGLLSKMEKTKENSHNRPGPNVFYRSSVHSISQFRSQLLPVPSGR